MINSLFICTPPRLGRFGGVSLANRIATIRRTRSFVELLFHFLGDEHLCMDQFALLVLVALCIDVLAKYALSCTCLK